jgi:predicted nucleic acid-binding protein
MTVCIDTNVVLGMFGRNSPWVPIRQALMDRRLIWALTTEILLEYEEVVAREMGIAAGGQLLRDQPQNPSR